MNRARSQGKRRRDAKLAARAARRRQTPIESAGWLETPKVLLRWSKESKGRRLSALGKALGALAALISAGAAVLLLIPVLVEFVFMSGRPIAIVDGESITTRQYAQSRDFRRFPIVRELNALAAAGSQTASANPGSLAIADRMNRLRTDLSTAEFQAVEDLINIRLLDKWAAAQGIEVSAETLTREWLSYLGPTVPSGDAPNDAPSAPATAEAAGSANLDTMSFLDRTGMDPGLADDLLRERILERIMEAQARSSVEPVQEQVRLIRLIAPTEEKAAEIEKRYAEGESWSVLAAEVSTPERDQKEGEDLGFVPKGILDKQLEDAAFETEPGRLADPVSLPDGFHLLLVISKEDRELSEDHLEQLRSSAVAEARQALRAASTVEYRLSSDNVDWARRHGLNNVGQVDPSALGGSQLP